MNNLFKPGEGWPTEEVLDQLKKNGVAGSLGAFRRDSNYSVLTVYQTFLRANNIPILVHRGSKNGALSELKDALKKQFQGVMLFVTEATARVPDESCLDIFSGAHKILVGEKTERPVLAACLVDSQYAHRITKTGGRDKDGTTRLLADLASMNVVALPYTWQTRERDIPTVLQNLLTTK